MVGACCRKSYEGIRPSGLATGKTAELFDLLS